MLLSFSMNAPGCVRRLGVLLQHGDKRIRVGANKLLGRLHLSVLEEHESGHSGDSELLAQVGKLVNVDLGEEDVLELFVVGVAVVSLQLAGPSLNT